MLQPPKDPANKPNYRDHCQDARGDDANAAPLQKSLFHIRSVTRPNRFGGFVVG